MKPFYLPGNGVVIHLPGLFEEAEKNLQKGEGNVASIHVHPCTCVHLYIIKYLHTTVSPDVQGLLFGGKCWGRFVTLIAGLKGWEERLKISDRAHIGE